MGGSGNGIMHSVIHVAICCCQVMEEIRCLHCIRRRRELSEETIMPSGGGRGLLGGWR